MAAALPIVSTGVGVASGLVGMFERNREQRRQQELVNAQLQANQNAQDMQFAAIMTGQQMRAADYMQSIAMRNMQYQQNVLQHQNAAMQNTAQHANLMAQLNTAQTAAQNQAMAGNSQAVAKETQYSRAGTEAEIGALQQAGQLSAAELAVYEQIQKELESGNSQFAAFLANTLESGPVVSDATQAMANRLDSEQYARMLAEMSNGAAMNEQAMQQILLSEEFGQLLDDIGSYEGNNIRQQYNQALGSLINNVNGQRAVGEIEYRTIAQALADSLAMEPGKNYIDQLSNNMNFLAANSQAIGQAGGIAAQNIAQNAQLLRSLPPRQSTLGGILSTVSAAAPLAGLFMNGNSGLLSRQTREPLDVRLDRPLIPLAIQLDRPLY